MKALRFPSKFDRKIAVSILACVVMIAVLWALPTGFEYAGAAWRDGGERVPARVLEVNNDRIVNTGLVQAGEQSCMVELLSGKSKGEICWAAR